MKDSYEALYESLTDAQRIAVDWDSDPMLVLAGPGSGKTRVLTGRIARILRDTPDKAFRVLALTFTNRAADEMRERVVQLCPNAEQRATVGTFHSFCMQVLQQHGAHVGVPPDFTIYSQDSDRKALLNAGVARAPDLDVFAPERYLSVIDRLKSALVSPLESASRFKDQREGETVSLVYAAYEAELRRANALDFNSLLLYSYQLFSEFSGVALAYRRTFRHWLIDEFQDTNRAQYKLLKAMAGDGFRNIFVVADDDQLIYQWNGASFQQLQRFRADFSPELLQLPTNYRCPPAIVAAANNLVKHNLLRSESKLEVVAAKSSDPSGLPPILVGVYQNEHEEAAATAHAIRHRGSSSWSKTAVIARSRALLVGVKRALDEAGVPSAISSRRDDFLSPHFQWMHAVLRQVLRPQDAKNFEIVLATLSRWLGVEVSPELIISKAQASGRSLLDEWLLSMTGVQSSPELVVILDAVAAFVSEPTQYRRFIDQVRPLFETEDVDTGDVAEDLRAWQALERSIRGALGKTVSLDLFLQQMALQSKEPPPQPDSVSLMTIHGAKGKEFDFVHLVGLADEILPSFHSLKAGEGSQEIEEERRNCFVAITRTREQLVLTFPMRYQGYPKRPSRFWKEMGIEAPALA